MKSLFVFLSFIFKFCVFAQSFEPAVSYKYMYSNQWDEIIKTYNFVRPFLTQKQSLLKHGGQVAFTYMFKSQKQFKQGISLSYSGFRSTSQNDNFANTISFNILNLGYTLRFQKPEKSRAYYFDITFGAGAGLVQRKINHESFVYDQKKSRAWGFGGDVNAKVGYKSYAKGSVTISPFVTAGYCPYFYAPDVEVVINQTRGLVAEDWTAILSVQAGIALMFN